MEQKQTAVDWLYEQIQKDQYLDALTPLGWIKVIEQAKAMEKEQITDAYTMGSYDMAEKEFKPEHYYNEEYGGNNE